MIILIVEKNRPLKLGLLKREADAIPAGWRVEIWETDTEIRYMYHKPYPEMTIEELLDSPIICNIEEPKIIRIN